MTSTGLLLAHSQTLDPGPGEAGSQETDISVILVGLCLCLTEKPLSLSSFKEDRNPDVVGTLLPTFEPYFFIILSCFHFNLTFGSMLSQFLFILPMCHPPCGFLLHSHVAVLWLESGTHPSLKQTS